MFNMFTSGPGWRLARSLVQLGNEVAAAHPDFTCLGTIGDASHVGEGVQSDHNPFIKDPATGLGIVRAIDIGGPDAELQTLQRYLWALYAKQDIRLYEFGYVKGTSTNLINGWGPPFTTHLDYGDGGHLHVSVTQRDGNHPSAAGYLPEIDNPGDWGIDAAIEGSLGSGTPVVDHYPAVPFVYPFRSPDHFGPITGPRDSHGGDPRFDSGAIISDVAAIQRRFNQIGVGQLAVDGRYGPQTTAAAGAFQKRYRPNGTTEWGQIWGDDCATLFGTLPK